MLPAQVTRVTKGVGSFLNIYFEVAGAEAHFWVYLCDWELLDGTQEVETSATISSGAKVEPFFEGVSLLSLETDGPEVQVVFSESKRLKIRASKNEYGDEDLFVLYLPEQPPLGYGPHPAPSSTYGWNTDN